MLRACGRRLVVAVFLMATGCIPNVSWLPDSSGFYFTTGERLEVLNRFEVRTKTSTRVASLEKSDNLGTASPGISPNGDRIALMQVIEGDRDFKIELQIYSSNGELVRKSKQHNAGPLATVMYGLTAWAPSGDKILATCGARSWIYSLVGDQWIDLSGYAVVFGHTPLPPDGTRFLVCKVNDDTGGAPDVYGSRFWSADWSGRKEPIDFSVKQFLRRFDPKREQELLHMAALLFPSYLDSVWAKDTAVVRWKHELMSWNLVDKQVRFRALDPPLREVEFEACHKFRFPKTGVLVRSIPEMVTTELKQLEQPFRRLEIMKDDNPPNVIAQSPRSCTFIPSPDSRWLAVHTGSRIHVIDDSGVVIAAVDVN